MNIRQDQKEQVEIVKHLCTFIRPEAFVDAEQRTSVSTEVLSEIGAKTGLSDEEIAKLLQEDPEFLQNYGSIERVDTRKG